MEENLTLLESAKELKTHLEKLKSVKAIRIENKIEQNIEIELSQKVNLSYEIQKFFIYNWKKIKNTESNASIFNNQIIIEPQNKYEYIFKKYKDVDDITFLLDFIEVKQNL